MTDVNRRPAPTPEVAPPVPAATRVRRSGWRDPRLWVGVLIVAVSVLGGARVFAAADDSVAVWAVAADAGKGARLDADDLVTRRVRFVDPEDLDGYYTVDDNLPADLVLLRGVGAGELLPRAAVGSAADTAGTVELPVAVDLEQVPPSVRSGSVVDVYLRDRGAAGARSRQDGPVLSGVTVVDAPTLEAGFGASTGRRQLVLAVPEEAAAAYFTALGRVDDPQLTVVRRG